MNKLKDAVRRGSALLGAAGLLAGVGASAIPALVPAAVSADALNPLTERSLTLSSSSPGWSYTDGSGNPTYAYPGSGANGQKTSNYFSFNVSSAHLINGMTFQYCHNPAGDCVDPGDDTTRGTDDSSHTDLKVETSTPTEISSANWTTIKARTEPAVPDGTHAYLPKSDDSEGNFVVETGGTGNDDTGATYSPGWVMKAMNQEESGGVTAVVSNAADINMIELTNTMGVTLSPGEHVQVKFFATDDNYIQNPGSGAFFVKINDYDATPTGGTGDTDSSGAIDGAETPFTYNDADVNPISGRGNIIDGGVTVANVMNESIEIQTKVLETMQFSVGTVDPDTLTATELGASGFSISEHGACDNILPAMTSSEAHNVLFLGDTNDEHALATGDTYGTHSYWRLSSNSSAGANVYYAGATLHDTEGDDINAIGTTAQPPQLGTEQFGLALDNDKNATDMTFTGNTPNGDNDHFGVNADNAQDIEGTNFDTGEDSSSTNNGALDTTSAAGHTWLEHGVQTSGGHNPQLYPLVAQTPYDAGGAATGAAATGTSSSVFNPHLNSTDFPARTDFFNSNIKFAFDPDANSHPALLATENNQVVDCVTGKMRYIGNIAAITPAGIYTTKINYVAAPQY
jgi:hypothetical protein